MKVDYCDYHQRFISDNSKCLRIGCRHYDKIAGDEQFITKEKFNIQKERERRNKVHRLSNGELEQKYL